MKLDKDSIPIVIHHFEARVARKDIAIFLLSCVEWENGLLKKQFTGYHCSDDVIDC